MTDNPDAEKPPDEPLVLMGIKMPSSLKANIETAAAMDERTMSAWARRVLREAAEKGISDHAKRIAASNDKITHIQPPPDEEGDASKKQG